MKSSRSIARLGALVVLVAPMVALAISVPRQPGVVRSDKVSKSQSLLTWRDRSDNETGFEIQRRRAGNKPFRTRAFVGEDVTQYLDRVRPATVFVYRVRAFNDADASPWSNECFVNRTPPSKPISVNAHLIGLTTARVTWDDRSRRERGFRIQRRSEGTGFGTIAEVEAGTEEYIDNTLAPGTVYVYRVRALGEPVRCIKHSKFSAERAVTSKGSLKVLNVFAGGGTGKGTVKSVPAGINCGPLKQSCSATYPTGTTVTLQAIAGANSKFKGWRGARVCEPTLEPCTIKMGKNRDIHAVFKRRASANNS